jgi:hypothetical protein
MLADKINHRRICGIIIAGAPDKLVENRLTQRRKGAEETQILTATPEWGNFSF